MELRIVATNGGNYARNKENFKDIQQRDVTQDY